MTLLARDCVVCAVLVAGVLGLVVWDRVTRLACEEKDR